MTKVQTVLKRWRARCGWTQKQAANILECSQPTVHMIEAGDRDPGKELARRIMARCK